MLVVFLILLWIFGSGRRFEISGRF